MFDDFDTYAGWLKGPYCVMKFRLMTFVLCHTIGFQSLTWQNFLGIYKHRPRVGPDFGCKSSEFSVFCYSCHKLFPRTEWKFCIFSSHHIVVLFRQPLKHFKIGPKFLKFPKIGFRILLDDLEWTNFRNCERFYIKKIVRLRRGRLLTIIWAEICKSLGILSRWRREFESDSKGQMP